MRRAAFLLSVKKVPPIIRILLRDLLPGKGIELRTMPSARKAFEFELTVAQVRTPLMGKLHKYPRGVAAA